MATVPSQSTVSAGGTLTAALWNDDVRDAINFFLNPPSGQFRQSAAQSIANNTYTALLFDVEESDNDSGHSTVANTSRYNAVTAGRFQLSGGYSAAASAGGGRRITRWAVNGTAVNGSNAGQTSDANVVYNQPARVITQFLNVGDYVELWAFQDSGGALNTSVTAENQPSMTVCWISAS